MERGGQHKPGLSYSWGNPEQKVPVVLWAWRKGGVWRRSARSRRVLSQSGEKIFKVSSIQTSEQRLQGRNATTYMSTAGRGPWVFDCKPLWDYNTQAVQESGVQEAAFSLKVCQVKPLELPVVRPEEAHTGFHPATKLQEKLGSWEFSFLANKGNKGQGD